MKGIAGIESTYYGSATLSRRTCMQITLAHVGAKTRSGDPLDSLTTGYLKRCSDFAHCKTEAFRTEPALLDWIGRQQGRVPAVVVFLDSRGRQMTSEAFAGWLSTRRDSGVQHIIFSVGPADGWSAAARARADLLLSLGPFTLAHAVARLVMAEQIYRAFTIVSGHPYHTGH